MSLFGPQTADTIPMARHDGQTITIRKLTGREYEAAQHEHLKTLVAGRSARGWSPTFQRILAGVATPADADAALADPLAGFDRFTIVKAGLLATSAGPIAATDRLPLGDPGLTDGIEGLDDDELDFIATQILRRTKPHLFHATAADADAEKKSA